MTDLLPLVDPMAISGISLPRNPELANQSVTPGVIRGDSDSQKVRPSGASPSGFAETPVPVTLIETPPAGTALDVKQVDPAGRGRRRRWVLSVVLVLTFVALGCAAVLGWSRWGFDIGLAGATAGGSGEQAVDVVPTAQQPDAQALPAGGVRTGDQRSEVDAALAGRTIGEHLSAPFRCLPFFRSHDGHRRRRVGRLH